MVTTNPPMLLERLLKEENESEWLEFKRGNADPQEIGEYVSALANAAMLADRDRAFLVFGIDAETHAKVGTSIKLKRLKKGGENFENWLCRLVEPRISIELMDFSSGGLDFSIIAVEPSYDRPVRFSGREYIRVGENKKPLSDFPEHERGLWLATGRRKFEDAVALSNQRPENLEEILDIEAYYTLTAEPIPKTKREILRRLASHSFILDNMEGGYSITNLGAILFAKRVGDFPSVAGKAVRVIKYSGRDKRKSELEQEATMGYAAGFTNMMRFIMQKVEREERYVDGVRRMIPMYPETAIREILANALIHQDFTLTGGGPLVEMYSDRIEVSNPGSSLIQTDRILDERRSRNEKLASAMRGLGLCEERGGGLDKTMIEVERTHLPAPEFISSPSAMRVVLFAPRPFSKMTKQDKQRACFFHCVLRWMIHDPMSNSSLRERFSLENEDYQAVSGVISDAIKSNRILPLDPSQGKRNARYVPYWAR